MTMFIQTSQAIDQQLVVFAVEGLSAEATTSLYMPKTHLFRQKGFSTMTMRTIHEIGNPLSAWNSIFYAASSSEFGCDNNGCNAIPRATDEMPNWTDLLEDVDDEDDKFTVVVFSEGKDIIDSVLDRNSYGYKPMSGKMTDAVLSYSFPNVPNSLVIVHFYGLDRIGSVNGYKSSNYHSLVGCIDTSIDMITRHLLERCPNRTTFMLISNHGGKDHQHSSFTLSDITVPFFMWGHRVAIKDADASNIVSQTTQIGPTLLKVLDKEALIPDFWLEKPILGVHSHHSNFELEPPLDGDDTYVCSDIPISVSYDALRFVNIFTIVTFTTITVSISLYVHAAHL